MEGPATSLRVDVWYSGSVLTSHYTMVASIFFSIIPINLQYTIVGSIWFSSIPILPQFLWTSSCCLWSKKRATWGPVHWEALSWSSEPYTRSNTLPETNMETQKGPYKDHCPSKRGLITWVSMLVWGSLSIPRYVPTQRHPKIPT